MKNLTVKIGLVLFMVALIFSKHLNECKYYVIQNNNEISELASMIKLPVNKMLTEDQYDLVLSNLSSQAANVILQSSQVTYRIFYMKSFSFWINLSMLIGVILIVTNLKIGREFLIPAAILIASFVFTSDKLNDKGRDNTRSYVTQIKRDFDYQIKDLSNDVDDLSNRVSDIEYDFY